MKQRTTLEMPPKWSQFFPRLRGATLSCGKSPTSLSESLSLPANVTLPPPAECQDVHTELLHYIYCWNRNPRHLQQLLHQTATHSNLWTCSFHLGPISSLSAQVVVLLPMLVSPREKMEENLQSEAGSQNLCKHLWFGRAGPCYQEGCFTLTCMRSSASLQCAPLKWSWWIAACQQLQRNLFLFTT